MLDRATIERLSKSPEKNAPALNVALAEEGHAEVLLALARSRAVGPEALEVLAERVAREGGNVGKNAESGEVDEGDDVARELDRLLVAHPRSPDAVRDAVLARHADEPFFVLAAATHPRATAGAIDRATRWAPASPVHDRLWLGLLDPAQVGPLTLEEWASDGDVLRREAAARIAREPAVWRGLARDPARQVRRALASNRAAEEARRALAASDPAPEVRARAEGALSAHGELVPGESPVDTARFAAALRAMETGGVLAPDVTRALASRPADLDDEGARLAAEVLPRGELTALLDAVVDLGVRSQKGVSLACGLARRRPVPRGARAGELGGDEELAGLVYDVVKALSRARDDAGALTGKARLAAWAAEGLARYARPDAELVADLACGALGGERMVLARAAAARPSLVTELCEVARSCGASPAALVELAWGDRAIDGALLVELAARVPRAKRRDADLPEDELDLDPASRPLDVLERAVLAATRGANVAPRAALAVIALDSRRVRYVLAAMPQWKGRLTGGRLARVLRQNAGALTAAQAEGRARGARVEGWTERLMSEVEVAIALAVGHLTGAEVARRIASGRQPIDDGLSLASGAEARAALEGPASVAPVLEWAARARASSPAALAVWLLLEKVDRARAPTLIASALDQVAAHRGVVPASVAEALALLEQRAPGRLEVIHPQAPRGRATLASGLARAYRGVGGMRDERDDAPQ